MSLASVSFGVWIDVGCPPGPFCLGPLKSLRTLELWTQNLQQPLLRCGAEHAYRHGSSNKACWARSISDNVDEPRSLQRSAHRCVAARRELFPLTADTDSITSINTVEAAFQASPGNCISNKSIQTHACTGQSYQTHAGCPGSLGTDCTLGSPPAPHPQEGCRRHRPGRLRSCCCRMQQMEARRPGRHPEEWVQERRPVGGESADDRRRNRHLQTHTPAGSVTHCCAQPRRLTPGAHCLMRLKETNSTWSVSQPDSSKEQNAVSGSGEGSEYLKGFQHHSRHSDVSGSQPPWFWVKYLNDCWMNCHEILNKNCLNH